jgi:hypothetical protein
LDASSYQNLVEFINDENLRSDATMKAAIDEEYQITKKRRRPAYFEELEAVGYVPNVPFMTLIRYCCLLKK